ncbi:MAG: hypothetical protein AB7P69_21810 [Candidatus Binatia bacterium]
MQIQESTSIPDSPPNIAAWDYIADIILSNSGLRKQLLSAFVTNLDSMIACMVESVADITARKQRLLITADAKRHAATVVLNKTLEMRLVG